MTTSGRGQAVDVPIAYQAILEMLPNRSGCLEAQRQHGLMGSVGTEDLGVCHGEAQYPGFNIDLVGVGRQGNIELRLAQLREGQPGVENGAGRIPQMKRPSIPGCLEQADLAVHLGFVGGVERFRQAFGAFAFQDANRGDRGIAHQDKIEMGFDGRALVHNVNFKLVERIEPVRRQGLADQAFKAMPSLQGQLPGKGGGLGKIRLWERRIGGREFAGHGGPETIQATTDVAQANVATAVTECRCCGYLGVSLQALSEDSEQGRSWIRTE